MSVGDFNDVLFSQDDRAEIGYGGQNDFVSKLIEKARANNQGSVKTPPPPAKNPGGRLAALRKPRRDSKEVESALRALKNPVRNKVNSPRPVTRSQTAGSSTPSRCSNSKPSLDDSTEAIFGALPPTPNLERTQRSFTPRNDRIVPFRRSDVNSSSTPDSNSKQATRPKYRNIDRATSSSSFGLDRSTSSTNHQGTMKKDGARRDEDDDSLDDDILNEATQRAELRAFSQTTKSRSPKSDILKDSSNDTPKTAGRVRPTSNLKTLNSTTERKSIDFKDKLRSSQTPRKSSSNSLLPVAKSSGPSGAKCSMEEIQKKKEAALLRRKLKMGVK